METITTTKKPMQIFISYAHKDCVSENIAEKYKNLIYDNCPSSVPYDIWYDERLAVGGDFTDEIADNIATSDCVIALVSENYNFSNYSHNEIAFAYKKRIPILVILLDDIVLNNDLDFYLCRSNYILRYALNETAFIEKLSRYIKQGLENQAFPLIGVNEFYYTRFPTIHPKSMRLTEDLKEEETYIERTDILEEIRRRMVASEHKKMVILSGMGGIGKTELAKAYAYRYSERNASECDSSNRNASDRVEDDSIGDIEAEASMTGKNTTSVNTYSREIELVYSDENEQTFLKLVDKSEEYSIVGNIAKNFDERTLIIIDNFQMDEYGSNKDFIRDVIENTGKAHVIITTRNMTFDSPYYDYVMPVRPEELNLEFLYQVFQKNYEHANSYRNTPLIQVEEEEYVKDICRTVNNVLGVELLAIQLRENDGEITIEQFHQDMQQTLRRLLTLTSEGTVISKEHNDQQYYYENPYLILKDIVFRKSLKMQKTEFTDQELKVIYILSLVPMQELSREQICIIIHMLPVRFRIIHDKLTRLGWVAYAVKDHGKDRKNMYSMHPLIAEFFQEYLYENKEAELDQINVECLHHIFALPYEELTGQRYLTWKLTENCKDGKEKEKFKALSELSYVSRSRKDTILWEDELITNIMPYIVYKEDQVCYGYQKLGKGEVVENKIVSLYSTPSVNKTQTGYVRLLSIITDGQPFDLYISDEINGIPVTEVPDGWMRRYSYEMYLKYFSRYIIKIGKRAFQECQNLSGELKLPEGLVSIGDSAFSFCENLSGELKLSESLISMGDGAFKGCKNLSGELKLSEGLTSIGNYAFWGCENLSGELKLPEGLTNIGDSAFSFCENLSGELKLPEGLTNIGEMAFAFCANLSGELKLPKGLMNIGDGAFEGCENLSGELKLPEGLENIGKTTFWGCRNLSGELKLLEGLENIGEMAFWGCENLSGELKLPEGLKSIGESAFERCENLSGKLKLPEGLENIGDRAFAFCTNLSGELKLPEYLRMGDSVFAGCFNLQVISKSEHIRKQESLRKYIMQNGELKLPEGLMNVGDRAFWRCENLSGELRLPEGLISIGEGAFYGCCNLNGELKLLEGLISIGEGAFYGCRNLSGELKLPESLVSIGYGAFERCENLSGELKLPEGLTNIGDSAFWGCENLSGELKLPDGLTNIGNGAFGGCENLSGELKLPEGLTNIGNGAFMGCRNLSGELKLPESLVSIGYGAFERCENLSGELKLPKGLTNIGAEAFGGCKSLSGELKLPEGLENIGKMAFWGCKNLSGELKLPEDLEYIGNEAFVGTQIEALIASNKNLRFPDADIADPEQLLIKGYPGSTAEEYASHYGYRFEYIE